MQTAHALTAAAGWPRPGDHGPDGTPRWIVSSALRERNLGDWQGRSYDRLKSKGLTQPLVRWDQAPLGGESLADLAQRLLDFLSGLPSRPTLLVSHAGPIRVLLGLHDGLDRAGIGTLRVPNASPIRVEMPARGWGSLGIPRS